MGTQEIVKVFGGREIRSIWDDIAEKWYFSVVAVLTDSANPLAYWRKLKQRLKAEGNETVTSCHALKLRAADSAVADCRFQFGGVWRLSARGMRLRPGSRGPSGTSRLAN